MSQPEYVPDHKLVPGMHMRPAYSAKTRRSLERIRVAYATGRIPWSTAVRLADWVKGRQ